MVQWTETFRACNASQHHSQIDAICCRFLRFNGKHVCMFLRRDMDSHQLSGSLEVCAGTSINWSAVRSIIGGKIIRSYFVRKKLYLCTTYYQTTFRTITFQVMDYKNYLKSWRSLHNCIVCLHKCCALHQRKNRKALFERATDHGQRPRRSFARAALKWVPASRSG